MKLKISKAARKFCIENGIDDVTFNLIETDVAGCCLGFAKEIQPAYLAPANAAGYRYYQVDGYHVFISRKIRIAGPLTLATEGIWKKRLCLDGAFIPL
jgi:hypothetical protein